MKTTILFMANFCICAASMAQKNSVSVTINDFYKSKYAYTVNDTLENYRSKLAYLFPSVGYYRNVKEHWGWGCELGFKDIHTKFENSNTQNSTSSYSGVWKSNQLYVSPALFETKSWDKYKLITSLTLPLLFTLKNEYTNTSNNIHSDSSTSYNNTSSVYGKQPNQLEVGIHINAGLFRKVGKKIEVGAQLSAGVFNVIQFGKSYVKTNSLNNGIASETNRNTKYQKFAYYGFRTNIAFALRYSF